MITQARDATRRVPPASQSVVTGEDKNRMARFLLSACVCVFACMREIFSFPSPSPLWSCSVMKA